MVRLPPKRSKTRGRIATPQLVAAQIHYLRDLIGDDLLSTACGADNQDVIADWLRTYPDPEIRRRQELLADILGIIKIHGPTQAASRRLCRLFLSSRSRTQAPTIAEIIRQHPELWSELPQLASAFANSLKPQQ